MAGPIQISRTLPKPLVVFDGDCGFCKRWIKVWQRTTGDHVAYAPLQAAAADFPEIPVESFEHELKLILPNGRVYGGAAAVFRSLNLGARPGVLARLALWGYRHVPGFAILTEIGYSVVASNRAFFSAVTRWMFKD